MESKDVLNSNHFTDKECNDLSDEKTENQTHKTKAKEKVGHSGENTKQNINSDDQWWMYRID